MASSSKPQPLKKESSSSPTGNPGDPPPSEATAENPSAVFFPETPASMDEPSFSQASHLTRQELLRRRLNHVKKLSRAYRDYYWSYMEEIKSMYREYYWKYGVSPFREDEEMNTVAPVNVERPGETNANNNCSIAGRNNYNFVDGGRKLGLGFDESSEIRFQFKYGGRNRCTFVGCKLKAMALTAFCHLHILSDPHQKLYKSCNYVIKRSPAGSIICGKPILRSNIPTLCQAHLEKAQKHITRALKKAGLTTSLIKHAPKFHVIVAEYVHRINAKRRESEKRDGEDPVG